MVKSRLHYPPIEMTVSAFLERLPVLSREFPQLTEQLALVARTYSDDDTVRIFLNGQKLVVDFLAFSKG